MAEPDMRVRWVLADAYQLWSAEAREGHLLDNVSPTEAMKTLGAAWRELTAEEKAPFEALASVHSAAARLA